MIYAKQSTAIIVTVGPVLDADGVAVTDGVVGDFKISKNGGAPAALNASATLTHRNTGHYSLSLTATDVNTVGTAEIVIDDTVNACPMKEIQVVEEAIYDALFAASATGALPVSTGGIAAAAFAAGAIDAAAIATGAIDADAIADGAIDAGAIANGAIDAATFAAGAIDAAALAADAGTEIATAVWASGTRSLTVLDEDSTTIDIDNSVWGGGTRTLTALDEDNTTLDLDATIRAAVGLAAANLDTQLADLPTVAELEARTIVAANYATAAALDAVDNFVDTEVAAIKAVTDLLPDGGALTSLATQASVNTIDDFLDTEIAAIKAKTDNLPSDPADASVIAGRFDTLDTSVADLPTNAELATALGTADDAVLAAIAVLGSPPSAATIASQVRTELTTELGRIDAAVSSRLPTSSYTSPPSSSTIATAVRSELTAELAKIAQLTFTVAGFVDANIQYVNDVQVQGTGTLGNEWGPV